MAAPARRATAMGRIILIRNRRSSPRIRVSLVIRVMEMMAVMMVAIVGTAVMAVMAVVMAVMAVVMAVTRMKSHERRRGATAACHCILRF